MSTETAAATRLGALRRRASGSHLMLPMADALTMLACFTLGGLVNFSYQNVTEERSVILLLLTGVCLAFFQYFGHYSRRRQFWQEIGDIALVAAMMLVIDAALLYLLKVNFSRVWVVTSWSLVIFGIPLVRRLVKQVSSSLGSWKQPTIVIGTGPSAREIAEAYAREGHLGYEVVAFLDPGAALEPDEPLPDLSISGRTVPVIPLDTSRGVLPEWLGQPHVVVALDLDEMLGRETFIETLSFYHGDIDVISPLKGLPINNTQVTHFFSRDILSMRIHNNLARPWAQLVKRLFDLAVACCHRRLHRPAHGAHRLADQARRPAVLSCSAIPGSGARAGPSSATSSAPWCRPRARCWPGSWPRIRAPGRSGSATAS